MPNDIAILDFGSGRISVLAGKRGANNTVLLSACQHVDYAGFSGGQWLRPELLNSAVRAAISAAEAESGLNIRHLYIGVPAEFSACAVREVTLSLQKRKKVTESDVEKLMVSGFEMLDGTDGFTLINRQPVYFTLDDERRVADPVGISSTRLCGLISYILAETRFTNFIDNIMEGLGLLSAEYVSAPLASSMFLLDESSRDNGAVLIDVGFITTSVAVVRGDGLLSLGSFSMGGGHISGDLAGYFSTSFEVAELLKRSIDLALTLSPSDVYEVREREFEAETAAKLVSARIATIARGVEKCLALNKYELPSAVYLTGGGLGFMRGGAARLGSELGCEVELLLPPIVQLDKPDLSSPVGLLSMVLDADEGDNGKGKKSFIAKLLGF